MRTRKSFRGNASVGRSSTRLLWRCHRCVSKTINVANQQYCGKQADTQPPFRLLHGNKMLIDWGSKLQVGVALSTADAEMAAVQRATCRSSLPAQILLEETLGFACPITHFADNQPCITAIKNGASQTLRYLCKTQRISIPFLHQIFNENSNLDFVETHHNVSDIMTKPLPANTHWQYVYELGFCSLSDFRSSA